MNNILFYFINKRIKERGPDCYSAKDEKFFDGIKRVAYSPSGHPTMRQRITTASPQPRG